MFSLINGIQLSKEIYKYDIILVGTNNYQKLTNGFQHEIRMMFPEIELYNMEKTQYAHPLLLGQILEYSTNNIIIVLCYITSYPNSRPDLQKDYLNYNALESCLIKVDNKYSNKNIACTLLGSSPYDGNGNENKIIEIFKKHCNNNNYYIYNAKQKSKDELIIERAIEFIKCKQENRELFYKKKTEYTKKKKEDREKRRKMFGISKKLL